ncbi:shieldin complex subunit 1 isoform X2 [Pogoniulus pusillus]
MEGEEMSPSHHSEESSVLDLPSACGLLEQFLPPPGSENSEELFASVDTFPSLSTGENNPPSATALSFVAGGCEEAILRCSSLTGQPELADPNHPALSWTCDGDSAEDPSSMTALDNFYKTYCKKRSDRMGPTYEAAAQCLAQRLSELANQEGTKYASRCLQMAQVVLNRDGCKIFPNQPTAACFAKPAEGDTTLGDRKKTPGLSDDVLQLLLRQTLRGRSPDASQDK